MGKGPESPDGDVSVPERKDEVAGGGGEEEEAEERGRVGGRGGPRPAASAGPHLRPPPAGGGAGRGGPARDGLGRGGRAAPPGHADSRGLTPPGQPPLPQLRGPPTGGAQPSPLGTPGEVGGSRGGRDGAIAGPHRRDGATCRRGGGRGAGRTGTKGTMSSGAKEGGGGSPAYHLPHPHPHPPQHAQYVGPYRLEKTLGKGQTGESGEGTPGVGAGELGGRGRDSWVF